MKKLVRTLNGLPIVITVTHARGYFSVTATHDRAGGCMHAEVIQAAPELSPLVALHLSDSNSGAPMHAEANGWYWVAGALGGLGQRFHGSNSDLPTRTTDDCARILADHVRADDLTVRAILGNVKSMAEMFDNVAARNWWQEWVKSQAARWSTEAENGRKQIAAL
jgi:hypothetical protein